jgi:hypothetical protein
MPTTRRYRKRSRGLPCPLRWEDCTIEQWREHRDEMLASSPAGMRPVGWWKHEAPAPRDTRVTEALQLHRLGVLARAELDALMPFWRHWEAKARGGLAYVRGPGDILEGERAYRAWRKWAGIPADLIPTRKSLARIFPAPRD